MPEPEPKKNEPSPKEIALQKQIEDMSIKLKEETDLRKKILSDEAIVSVLHARRDGKKVSVVEDKTQTLAQTLRGDEKPSNNDVNEMSNKELFDVLVPAVEERIAAAIENATSQATRGIDERFDAVASNQNKLHTALVKQAAAAGITTMRASHSDFDQYGEDAIKVAQTTGLPIEDAYILVKGRAGLNVPSRREVESERPSSAPSGKQPVRRRESLEDEAPRRRISGARSFRELVREGVDTVLERRQER